jgi:hypothetical protein
MILINSDPSRSVVSGRRAVAVGGIALRRSLKQVLQYRQKGKRNDQRHTNEY